MVPYNSQSSANNTAPDSPWVQFTIPSAACEERVEEIYEDLCYVKFTSAMPEVATLLYKRLVHDNAWIFSNTRLFQVEVVHAWCGVNIALRVLVLAFQMTDLHIKTGVYVTLSLLGCVAALALCLKGIVGIFRLIISQKIKLQILES